MQLASGSEVKRSIQQGAPVGAASRWGIGRLLESVVIE
jgi:hypothetical protein